MKTSHLWAIESRFLWWAVLPAETVPSGYLWDDLTAFQRFSAVMVVDHDMLVRPESHILRAAPITSHMLSFGKIQGILGQSQ